MKDFTENTLFANRYLLLKKIGIGGFAEVWKAEDQITKDIIALKIFIQIDEEGIEIAKEEFKISSILNHSNILKIRHYDIWDNQPYLVMNLCNKGTTLRLAGKLDEREIVKIAHDISAGLEYLHNLEIIHRDIKPDNFLIDDHGTYMLSDLGISQRMRRTLTKSIAANRKTVDIKQMEPTGSTPLAYQAPELFDKDFENKKPVKANDIFALGVSLYELASGELPFGESGGVLLLKGVEIPNVPKKYSNELNNLIQRCFSKQPWDRLTAKEIKDICDSFLKNNCWIDTAVLTEFDILKKEGDFHFGKQNYKKALSFYEKANKLRADNYVSQQINRCKENIKPLPFKKKHFVFILAIIVIFLIFFSFFFYTKHKQKQYAINYQKGKDFYFTAQYDSALVYFNKAYKYYEIDSVGSKIEILNALIPAMSDYYRAKYEVAFNKFKKAADLGSGDAYYYMGELTYNGLGTIKDYRQGWAYSNKATELGFKMAYWRIAYAYETGKGVEKDQYKADKYYLEALEAMKKLAEGGDPEALGNLGAMYSNGSGVTKNETIAFEYNLKSAEKGYAFKMCNLAQTYWYGVGVSKNIEKAVEWYRKSADMGDPTAQLRLGNLYLEGDGVDKNISLGLELINKAANQNYSDALSRLGYLYYFGLYVQKDYVKSHEFTKKAVDFDNDNVVAIENLAFNFKEGNGTDKNYAKAKKYYLKAVQIDSTRTDNYIKVANLYYKGGYGIVQSDSDFIKYCEMAEKYGNSDATELLGWFYNSRGVQSFNNDNYSQARKYFNLSISKNYQKAKENLYYMNENDY